MLYLFKTLYPCFIFLAPTLVNMHIPPIYLHWDFRKFGNPPVWNIQFHELDFFPSLKTNCIFLPVQTGFFPSFWSRVKYFDGPCLTIYSLFTIYRDTHYQFLVWWIHCTHCCESKKWKPEKFHLCSLWNNIFNYPNWDFGFC